jgi:ATP phosphoribosyltransferase
VIVDITSTGSTLRANHLKVLKDGVILQSQACLFAPKPAPGGADRRDTVAALAAALGA